jgi:hypothetical protein
MAPRQTFLMKDKRKTITVHNTAGSLQSCSGRMPGRGQARRATVASAWDVANEGSQYLLSGSS